MATANPVPATPKPRSSISGFFLRLLFRGYRSLVTLPLLVLVGFLAWQTSVYAWYRGISKGERTGMIVKVSKKGTPLCRYNSIEMRVGAQPGTAVLTPESLELAVDDAYEWLLPQLREAERNQSKITVEYRQDGKNLPWRFCIGTEYHATGVVK